MECIGSERSMDLCPFNGWGDHDCSHSEDAGAVCQGKLVGDEGRGGERREERRGEGKGRGEGRGKREERGGKGKGERREGKREMIVTIIRVFSMGYIYM